MEVRFTPHQQAGLSLMAEAQGRDAASLVREAVDRLLGYDEWFLREAWRRLISSPRPPDP